MDSMPVVTYGDTWAGLKAVFNYLTNGSLLTLVGKGKEENKVDKHIRKGKTR
jgi:hypothetical protein